jgi:hypothetical protein
MGFNSKVTLVYDFATTFSRKMQKTKKMTEFDIYFSSFVIKEASKVKNVAVFGIFV